MTLLCGYLLAFCDKVVMRASNAFEHVVDNSQGMYLLPSLDFRVMYTVLSKCGRVTHLI